jgi:hypothetical protein
MGDYVVLTAVLLAPFWIRRPQDFLPPTVIRGKKPRRSRIVSAFVDHLFAIHPVPQFLYTNWFSGLRMKWICWFILLGQGESLHRCAHIFGWDISNEFTHYLYGAPEESPLRACMWAEIHRLGGTALEYRRMVALNPLCLDPTSDLSAKWPIERPKMDREFWRGTLRWLIRNREYLTDGRASQILNWAIHEYTECERTGRQFSWRGRTVAAAQRAATEYERSINQSALAYYWQSHGWNWQWSAAADLVWTMVELTSGAELSREGKAQRHCVAGYAYYCATGSSAIFSLRRNDARQLTVQLDLNTKTIIQARGKANRLPIPDEERILKAWLQQIVRPEHPIAHA